MKVIKGKIGAKKIFDEKGIALTIGNFDGIHKGHQKLIKETMNQGLNSMVMTFDPHPNCIIKPKFEYYFLTPLERKINLIRKIGPTYLYIVHFDMDLAHMGPDEFILNLKKMNVKKIICGEDFHFAYLATGSIFDLKKHFDVVVCEKELINNQRISSTYIKELLQNGQIKEANYALGRPYFILGVVVHGNEIGRKLGFPTANIDIFGNVAPKKGVYVVKVKISNKFYYGMANLGNNPTINYIINNRLEINIFDFSGDLYGKKITIYFLDYIREEKKFNSEEELICEIKKNRMQIKEMIERKEINET